MRLFLDLMWYFKLEKKNYGVGILLLVIVAILNMLPPYVIGVLVDAINNQTLTSEELRRWLVILVLNGVALYVLRYGWRLTIFGAAARLGKLLRFRLYEHLTRLSPRFYHKQRAGDLMAHLTNDISAVEMTAGAGVLTLVDSITTGSMVIISMLIFVDWRLTLIALLPMLLMAWTTRYYGSLLHKRFHKAQAAFSDLNGKVQENISGVRVVKAFGREEAEKEEFRNVSEDVVQKNVAVAKVDALFDPTISVIVGTSFFLALAFGAVLVLNDQITLGQLTQFTMYLGQFIWPMLAFGWLINIMERGSASYKRVNALLQVQPDIVDRAGALDENPSGELDVRIDSFSYPEHQEPALQRVAFTLQQGQTLGIVGKTGSGKSTIFRLLLREFDLQNGDLCIGGTSIYQFRLDRLRCTIGYVPQDNFLFSATIAENIAFGRPGAALGEIEDVARIACVHDDILRFEDKYGTVVGERGVTLSGGQKQRISIARALLLNPEILVLDDSLSAVDAKTEKQILQALKNQRSGRTTLISSHRLSAIEHADIIIVLRDGSIAESGNHEQLLALDGWYAATYRSQQLEDSIVEGGK